MSLVISALVVKSGRKSVVKINERKNKKKRAMRNNDHRGLFSPALDVTSRQKTSHRCFLAEAISEVWVSRVAAGDSTGVGELYAWALAASMRSTARMRDGVMGTAAMGAAVLAVFEPFRTRNGGFQPGELRGSAAFVWASSS